MDDRARTASSGHRDATRRRRHRMARRWRRSLTRLAPLTTLTVLAIAVGLVVRLDDPSALRRLRNIVFDEYQNFHPRPSLPDLPVRVVAIDEASLARIGQWPWPRARVAELVARLGDLGAAAIGVDVIFTEPDRMSPEAIARLVPEGPVRERLAASLGEVPRGDERLAAALAAVPSVLGVLLDETDGGAGSAQAAPKAGFAFAGDLPGPFLPSFSGARPPLAILSQAAQGLGALNWLPDADQVVRAVPLLFHVGDTVYLPGLAAEALRVAQGASTFVVRSSNASGETAFGATSGVNAVRIGAFTVPTAADGSVLLHFARESARRYVPAWQVLEGSVGREEIEGRIVLVGATATGLFDLHATPLDSVVPGIDINAQLIEQIMLGVTLQRPDWAAGLEIVVFVALASLFGLAAAFFSPPTAAMVGVSMLVTLFAASYGAFVGRGLLIDPSFAAMGSGVALLVSTMWVAARERADRRWVRHAFGRYVADAVVEELASNPESLALGGEIRPMTILFMDIRNFTTIGETMDAAALTTYLNAFLTAMTGVILDRRGTIDKYMGDAVMAFWNAPVDDADHAVHACGAALQMLDALGDFNALHDGVYPFTGVGIGLNTGSCCVGNLGSAQRFDYSVIGDEVNVASRLETSTKVYGLPILVGEITAATARAAGYVFVHADTVRVKGKTGPIAVYGLIGGPAHPVPPEALAILPALEDLVDAAQHDDAARMRAALTRIGPAVPREFDTFVRLYRRRLSRLGETGPAPGASSDGS